MALNKVEDLVPFVNVWPGAGTRRKEDGQDLDLFAVLGADEGLDPDVALEVAAPVHVGIVCRVFSRAPSIDVRGVHGSTPNRLREVSAMAASRMLVMRTSGSA